MPKKIIIKIFENMECILLQFPCPETSHSTPPRRPAEPYLGRNCYWTGYKFYPHRLANDLPNKCHKTKLTTVFFHNNVNGRSHSIILYFFFVVTVTFALFDAADDYVRITTFAIGHPWGQAAVVLMVITVETGVMSYYSDAYGYINHLANFVRC